MGKLIVQLERIDCCVMIMSEKSDPSWVGLNMYFVLMAQKVMENVFHY